MKTFKILIFLLFVFVLNNAESQIINFRIYPSGIAQIEPSIARHPSNPMIMFSSAYTISGAFRSEGVYITTNGGINWFGSDTCNSGSSSNNHGGDPGPVIDKDGRFILTHQGSFITGMFSNYSTNFGTTWSSNQLISSGDQDKGTPGTDDVSSSIYYGRTYLVWTRFVSPYPIVSSYTVNGGINWTSANQINTTPSGYISTGADIKINYDGTVYVCWAGSLTSTPQNEKFCGFAKSTNGGENWISTENIYSMNGVKTSSLQPWNIRINGYPHLDADRSGGSRNGWIYIVTGEKNLLPAGSDPDIVFHRSTDRGNTWSSGIRVNQDPIDNGKVQYFPAISVDDNGGINVVYYDNRNLSSDSMDMYLSRSTDGGINWRDYRINEHRFKPKTVSGSGGSGNQGDNIGVIYNNDKLWALWMDDHTGVYQIWAAAINLNSIGIRKISSALPDGIGLDQNYPNPFNPSTKISYRLTKSDLIRISIFDIRGNEVSQLINERQSPGSYETDFNAGDLPGGVYFCILYAGGKNIDTKKLVLLK